jgi:DNA-binding transcriptional MerR regulator
VEKGPDAFRTISEVAEDLDLPQHVLRFWETRFGQIKPLKRGGGRRYYRPDDVDLLRGIRHLLYGEGYTIRGVQQILREQGVRHVQSVGRSVEVLSPKPATPADAGHGGRAEGEGFGGIFNLIPSLRGARAEDAPDLPRIVEVPVPRPADGDNGEDVVFAFHKAPPPEPERRAPLARAVEEEEPVRRPAPESGRLTPEQIRLLKTTLFELGECQRMLDAANGRDS